MAINNPYVPGDPYSYDLKWLVAKIKEHAMTIQQIIEDMPDDNEIKQIVQQMIDSGEITALALASAGIFNVKDYGAVGDQFTDDTEAIRTAYNAAVSAKGILYFPDGDYYVTETIDFAEPLTIYMEGTIYSPIQDVIVHIGKHDTAQSGFLHRLKVKGISPVNTGSVGIFAENISDSRFYIDNVYNVETGLKCKGFNKGFQNNTIILGIIHGFTYGLVLDNENTDPQIYGWCNENLFIGGRFAKYSSQTNTTTAIKFDSHATPTYNNNNNVFLKQNLEGNNVGIDFEYANYNHFIRPRFEGNANPIINGNNNSIEAGYGNIPLTAPGTNIYREVRGNYNFNFRDMKFVSTGSFTNESASDGTNGTIKNIVTVVTGGMYAPTFNYYGAGANFTKTTDGYLKKTGSGSAYWGVLVDVKGHGADPFWFAMNEKTTLTRGMFIMFDSSNQIIETAPDFYPGQTANLVTISSTKFFQYGGNNPNGYSFVLPANVDHVLVAFSVPQDSEIKSVLIGSSAQLAIREHGLVLPAIPTVAGSYIGQTVTASTGASFWIWNGTTWIVK